jgi:hypothetical protein
MFNAFLAYFGRVAAAITQRRDGSSPELAIRVWLFRDGKHFIAQGIDVDYVACGQTRDDAERHFAEGFAATVEAHLEEFGNLDRFIKPAPPQVFSQFHRAVRASRLRTRVDARPIPGAAHKSIDTPLLNSVEFVEACAA